MSTAEPRLPTCYRHPDRETGLSCSECGRPICTECMTPAAVGIRCPDHAGKRRSVPAPRVVRRTSTRRVDSPVTWSLIIFNVAIYLITVSQGGGSLNQPGGSLFTKWLLFGPLIAHGDWWRLITPMFPHLSLGHIGLNMLGLWSIGRAVENYLGPVRFGLIYFVSGLAGSAGSLIWSPLTPAAGASGAIFGILGAMLIIEWTLTGRLGGQAATWIAILLAYGVYSNLTGGNIGVAAHVGGLVGGVLSTLALANWHHGKAAFGRIGVTGVVGLAVVAALSIAISYWQVRGLA